VTSPAKPKDPTLRYLLYAAGGLVAVFVAIVVCGIGAIWYQDRQPSYGPPSASELDLTVAPGVSVDALPSHRTMGSSTFDGFDVAANGAVVVSIYGRLFDLMSGDKLLVDGTEVESFAFIGDGLALVDREGRLGYAGDGRFQAIGTSPVEDAQLSSTADRSRLVFFSRRATFDRPALAVMPAGEPVLPLTGSDSGIDAAAGDGFQTVFAIGTRIWRVVDGGVPSPLLTLPGGDSQIVGLAISRGSVYVSTDRGVWAVDSDMAVPVVLGLGGKLHATSDAVYVLSARNGRLYLIGFKT